MATEAYQLLEVTAQSLLDTVIWMSRSQSFGVDGEMRGEWERRRELVVYPAMELLGETSELKSGIGTA